MGWVALSPNPQDRFSEISPLTLHILDALLSQEALKQMTAPRPAEAPHVHNAI